MSKCPDRAGVGYACIIEDYFAPSLPVVMVTKNEAESVMEEAIGMQISDYLTKPVNPTQVLLTCKKFIEGKKIVADFGQQHYLQDFATPCREDVIIRRRSAIGRSNS